MLAVNYLSQCIVWIVKYYVLKYYVLICGEIDASRSEALVISEPIHATVLS